MVAPRECHPQGVANQVLVVVKNGAERRWLLPPAPATKKLQLNVRLMEFDTMTELFMKTQGYQK